MLKHELTTQTQSESTELTNIKPPAIPFLIPLKDHYTTLNLEGRGDRPMTRRCVTNHHGDAKPLNREPTPLMEQEYVAEYEAKGKRLKNSPEIFYLHNDADLPYFTRAKQEAGNERSLVSVNYSAEVAMGMSAPLPKAEQRGIVHPHNLHSRNPLGQLSQSRQDATSPQKDKKSYVANDRIYVLEPSAILRFLGYTKWCDLYDDISKDYISIFGFSLILVGVGIVFFAFIILVFQLHPFDIDVELFSDD